MEWKGSSLHHVDAWRCWCLWPRFWFSSSGQPAGSCRVCLFVCLFVQTPYFCSFGCSVQRRPEFTSWRSFSPFSPGYQRAFRTHGFRTCYPDWHAGRDLSRAFHDGRQSKWWRHLPHHADGPGYRQTMEAFWAEGLLHRIAALSMKSYSALPRFLLKDLDVVLQWRVSTWVMCLNYSMIVLNSFLARETGVAVMLSGLERPSWCWAQRRWCEVRRLVW